MGLALLLLILALLFWLYIVMSDWTGGALLVLYAFALMLLIIILLIFIFRRDLLCPLGGLGLLLLMSKYYTLCPPPPFPYVSFSNALSPLSPVTLLLIALWNLHGQALYLGILLFIFACLLGNI